ncbi:protein of unknown function [Taphrina deformans PYCC 5710]|uniref:Uncharacterized protein n=1 Tax=Taphrina deformans (strain PYCC 5710 / ATCC 11124 / CBS 356.35 / IMI 108563 / JCM 9778 / NBRC 8474) TaxID=1097556 RepID=R4XAI5_TAPDE|nr:protein of unknown function [Taphrina deformans PYCC 5710]|eukprot:CCG82793.1 protein of unknown function [Taphrina deformans PYCC 5710]
MSSSTENKAQHAEQSAEQKVTGGHETVSKSSHESSSSSSKETSSTTNAGVGSGHGVGHDSTTGTGTTGSGSHDHSSRGNPTNDTTDKSQTEGNSKANKEEERNSDGFIPGEPLEKNHKASVHTPSNSHTKDHDSTTVDHEHSHKEKEGVGAKLKNAFHHEKKTT